MTTRLPDKLSDLLDLAVDCAEKCEADPNYELDTTLYHHRRRVGDPCGVDMAGAVMAKALGMSHAQTVYPESFDADTAAKLFRIERMQDGADKDHPAWRALADVRLGIINGTTGFASWATYREAVRRLREAGL